MKAGGHNVLENMESHPKSQSGSEQRALTGKGAANSERNMYSFTQEATAITEENYYTFQRRIFKHCKIENYQETH